MNKKVVTKVIIALLIIVFSYCGYILFLENTTKNFLDNPLIDHGVGWKNNQSFYAGSELHFIFSNSSSITFELFTNSKADQGIEILIDNKKLLFPSTFMKSKNLPVNVDKNTKHIVTVRHYCIQLYDPCSITLKGIFLKNFAKLYPYQHQTKIISILGDSISTIYGLNNYSQLLSNNLKYELHDASVMGSTVSKVKGVDNANLRYKKDLMSFRSEVIIIFLGTNDAGANVPLDVFERDYAKIVSGLTQYSHNNKIFLVSLLPRKDKINNIIPQYNKIIKKIATSYNLQYLDLSTLLSESDFSDSIHPSLGSQEKIASYLTALLLPFLK